MSRVRVDYLDLAVYRASPDDYCLSFRPFVKPTARGIPLNPSSSRPRYVFQLPLSLLTRYARNSCCQADSEDATCFFIVRLLAGMAEPSAIANVILANLFSHIAPFLSTDSLAKISSEVQSVTVIVQYHPLPDKAGLRSVVRLLSERLRPQLKIPCGFDICFRIAWSKGGTHLVNRLRRL